MHWQTHTVFNQPVALNNSNLFLSDTALREAVLREGAGWDWPAARHRGIAGIRATGERQSARAAAL